MQSKATDRSGVTSKVDWLSLNAPRNVVSVDWLQPTIILGFVLSYAKSTEFTRKRFDELNVFFLCSSLVTPVANQLLYRLQGDDT